MRLLTFIHDGVEQVGVRRDDTVIPVSNLLSDPPRNLQSLLDQGLQVVLQEAVPTYTGPGIPANEVQYQVLLPKPGKLVCIGRNYAAHAAERGADVPTFPEVFFRGPTSLVPHAGALVRPKCSSKFDFEGEIAFVIGKRCRHASEAEALDYVAGYTLFQDATLRDYQRFASQWTVGKNFDGTGGFGPELVTADELPPGANGLTLTTRLNGELMQEGNTEQFIFPVTRLIAILSQCMTLEPGDVVSTGTPSGVGSARNPPVWLEPGDVVEVEVAGIGTLRNVVEDEEP